ncbi:hypothetical protein Har1130_03200 [Haloarcula sp. CBA1130]|uniref:hypothetical protein n=1 Tax=unclassified Haloarcula TaxID=2624677 RepID=UPI0012444487|nr:MULTISPECIES: hypothetical protein [unclassified Haloarcula]KAA9396834.1 hypothetical protein Har1129_00710 [Haloarcula sp. CBA1129]KAA9401794.1 hypothetical protein Har1130_03200 [Haloarcula sp. CBA1130]
MSDETCAEDECTIILPEFPDESGYYYCEEHYPEPNDGTFSHIPDEFADYREERREMYDE